MAHLCDLAGSRQLNARWGYTASTWVLQYQAGVRARLEHQELRCAGVGAGLLAVGASTGARHFVAGRPCLQGPYVLGGGAQGTSRAGAGQGNRMSIFGWTATLQRAAVAAQHEVRQRVMQPGDSHGASTVSELRPRSLEAVRVRTSRTKGRSRLPT